MKTIEGPELARSDASILRIEGRARRQRGCLLLMSLWVLGWSGIFINGLIQYHEWLAPLLGFAVFTLVVSPFTLIYTLPLSLIGYWIGGIPIWKSYRYHWTLALPIAAAVTIQVPTNLNRLQPEKPATSYPPLRPLDGLRFVGDSLGFRRSIEYDRRLGCILPRLDRVWHSTARFHL